MTRDPAGGQQAADDDTAATDLPGTDAPVAGGATAAPKGAGDARRAAQALRAARRRRPDAEPTESEPAESGPAESDPTVAEPTEAVDAVEADAAPAVTLAKTAATTSTTPVKTAPTKTAAPTSTKPSKTPKSAAGDTDTESDTGTDTGKARRPRRRPRRITAIAAVLAVLAAAFVVVAAVVNAYAQDTRTDSPARARDSALLAARQDITVLNTLDYRDVDGGLQRWVDATTGTLRDQLSQVTDADKQALAVSQSVTTAKVLAAAVTQLDIARGSATVIASVQIDVTKAGAAADPKRSRFSLTMTQVAGSWKIGAVQQVGVQVS